MTAVEYTAVTSRKIWYTPLLMLVVAITYFLSARLGLLLAFADTNASPVWPPSGIAFAAVLLLGNRIWPGILLGAFLANLLTFQAAGTLSGGESLFYSCLIGIGNTLEAITGARLLNRWQGRRALPRDIQGVVHFVAAAGLMSLVSSLVGCTTLLVSGSITPGLAPAVWFTWWLGDSTGILTLTPLILAWLPGRTRATAPGSPGMNVSIQLAVALMSACIFWEWLVPDFVASLPYLVVPLVLWSAYRSGVRGAATSLFIMSVIAVIGTTRGLGAFIGEDNNISLLLLQFFIAVISITAMTLAAAVEERNRWEQKLYESNVDLEKRIAQRTTELARSNLQLQTHQDHLQELVAQRTRELEESNRELESFSYSISHDLRTPLRSIDGFSALLGEDYAAQIPAEGQEYLQRIRAAAQRMGHLIDDLLQLSRIGRHCLQREDTDLSELSERIIADLRAMEPERRVQIHIEPDLHARVDSHLFRQVLENLLSNAWKYSGTVPAAEIRFEARQLDGETVFCIADNGVGFDMQYASKLFAPFERLHAREFPGTGIGLATVARIVQRHGGRVWARASVNQGATFCFTAGDPRQDPPPHATPADHDRQIRA